jgi:hypothetical protein
LEVCGDGLSTEGHSPVALMWLHDVYYVGTNSPHIPVVAKGLSREGRSCYCRVHEGGIILTERVRLQWRATSRRASTTPMSSPRRHKRPRSRSQSPVGFSLRKVLSCEDVGSSSFELMTRCFIVNVTDRGHERELMAAESPGPKYNVESLAANGGMAVAPGYSFAQPAPESRTRLPNVDSPRRGHRESWLSVINHNGVLVMPGSPVAPPRSDLDAPPLIDETKASHTGTAFGNEHRFGHRNEKAKAVTAKTISGSRRVQFVSAKHTRENMGEFSPGPIYAAYNPDCPGGRLAPSPKSTRREPPPGSPKDGVRNPHANLNSRSSWLAGNVRKMDGVETVLMRTGDVPPGPGSYGDPSSSFTKVSHNVKAKGVMVRCIVDSGRYTYHAVTPLILIR